MKKLIYLFLALLFPSLIFVFLKKFGKNEFNVPVYFVEGVDSAACQIAYAAPYKIPDSVWQEAKKPVTVFTIETNAHSENLKSLEDDFDSSEYAVVQLDSSQSDVINCLLLLKQPWTTVMVDNQNQIRGYYMPATREELDRLKLEMNILLKHY